MSSEDDDRQIEALEAKMRGTERRTVVQDRIAQMMGQFGVQLRNERLAEEQHQRALARQRREEFLARVSTGDQDASNDGIGENAVEVSEIPLRR